MRVETRAVRAGRGGAVEKEGRPHAPPIDLSTTYAFHRSDDAGASMDALLGGAAVTENPIYARLHNPTVARFEEALAVLEGAEDAVAFASGMAATTATLLAAATLVDDVRRSHVVAVRPVYGGTDHLLESGLLGTEVTWTSEDRVSQAIRADTGLVFIETPANPTLALVDIRRVVEETALGSARFGCPVPVAVDSTFATPVLQTPLALGATLTIHSATKFLGGHGDVMGGVVATSDVWARRIRQVRMITGGLLHPLGGYLLHRGLQTLPIRVRAQQAGATVLAKRLLAHPAVRSVHFPGLRDDARERRLLNTQQSGPGSVLSFQIGGGAVRAAKFIEALQLITPAVSLGSVDTLIQAPALLTHRVVDPKARTEAGIPDDLLRLSVGLESVDDLWEDLERALSRASADLMTHDRGADALQTVGL